MKLFVKAFIIKREEQKEFLNVGYLLLQYSAPVEKMYLSLLLSDRVVSKKDHVFLKFSSSVRQSSKRLVFNNLLFSRTPFDLLLKLVTVLKFLEAFFYCERQNKLTIKICFT